ncbi:MAG: efflux RND transporter periplasmic adaptor subunit [Planctomycetota bacterium]|nr:efflux RND transporter periplasmic adaptor subunit [Planctomycetota bacterium]
MVKKLIYLLLVLLALGAAGVVYLGAGAASNGETYVVTKGSVHRFVRGSGRVEGTGETALCFGMAGRLEAVNAKEGQEVVLNDTLAELNPAEIDKQIKQSAAALREAEAELDVAKTPPNPEAIRQAEEKYEQAKGAVTSAENKLKLLLQPPKPPAPPDWEVAAAERAVQAAQNKLELTQLELKKSLAGPNPDDVEVAKRKWEAAVAEREGAQRRLDAFKGGVPLPLFGKEPKETKADLEAALERAKEAEKVAAAEYDKAKRGPKPEDIRAAELKVEMAKTDLEGAKASKERLTDPKPPPPAPAHDIEQARLALTQAQSGERLAKAALDEAKRPPDPAKVRVAEAAKERKEGDLALLKLRKEGLQLRAPFDGLITRRHAEPGATVQAFVPIVTMVDFSKKRVRAEIDIGRMAEIKPGMNVVISSRAFNKETLDGKVLELGRVGVRKITVEDPSASKGGEIVEALIAVEEPKSELKKEASKVLRVGLPVEIEITVERRDNVLTVPRSCVPQADGQEFVWLVERNSKSGTNEAPKRRDVKCGMYDDHFVEILSGLTEGDRIVKPRPVNTR